MRPSLFPAALILLSACAPREPDWYATFGQGESPFDDENGVYRGPTRVERFYLDCRPEDAGDGPSAWLYDTWTVGWALEVVVTIHRWYPDMLEQHGLSSVERGADNQWEHLDAELPVVAEGEGEASVTTKLDCDWTFDTWRVEVYDLQGIESDCVVFGYDPSRLNRYGTCREIPLVGG